MVRLVDGGIATLWKIIYVIKIGLALSMGCLVVLLGGILVSLALDKETGLMLSWGRALLGFCVVVLGFVPLVLAQISVFKKTKKNWSSRGRVTRFSPV